jgi:hypothetical protein
LSGSKTSLPLFFGVTANSLTLRNVAKLPIAAGTIVLILNYTGDRINFGLATEKEKKEGNDVRRPFYILWNGFVLFVNL